MTISTPWVSTQFGWKEENRVAEKVFVWGSKQLRQNNMYTSEESEWTQVITIQIKLRLSLDHTQIKVAVSSNMVEFFNKNLVLTQVDII